MDILVNCAKSDTARVYFRNICKWNGALYNSDYESLHLYNGKQNLAFYNTNGSKAQSEIQEAANATLQAAMAGTEYILRSKLNMSLKTLGFKAYKL